MSFSRRPNTIQHHATIGTHEVPSTARRLRTNPRVHFQLPCPQGGHPMAKIGCNWCPQKCALSKGQRQGSTFTAKEALGLASFLDEATVAAAAAADDQVDVNACIYKDDGKLGGPCTAAIVAAYEGHCKVLKVLLDTKGCDPNKLDKKKKNTPCYAACWAGKPDAVELLLEHGADPNAINKNGWTPFMIASQRKNTACLRALAEGAEKQGKVLDVNAKATGGSWEGKTALDIYLAQPGGTRTHAPHLRTLLELGATGVTERAKKEKAGDG